MNRRFLLQTLAAAAAWGAVGLGHAQTKPNAKTFQLSGQTLDAKPYDLSQDQGKAILVFFWSTDCSVCRDKMSELRSNYAAWRDKGFQLVAVNLDKNLADVQAYDRILAHTVPMNQKFPSLWRADPAHRDSFGAVTKAPTSFLINRQGQLEKEIRGRIPAELWDDIAELVLT
ncbi:MAG: hypothetical protein RIS44_1166 [Pseudomonadota bacterium]|jgi:peroxiredoxin